jgi:acyl-CoA thioesterase-1
LGDESWEETADFALSAVSARKMEAANMAGITFFSSALRRNARSIVAVLVFCFLPELVEAQSLRLLVFGDSLSSGYHLPDGAAFPNVLARRLHSDGYGDVIVFNGSEAGETTANALQRLPSALQYGADLVIVELGGNDMLNKTDPQTVFGNLDQIIRLCKVEGARVILAGMLSLPKFGPAYKASFDAIYPTLATRHKISLYPFFLSGVFGDPRLMLSDGKHPNVFGVQRIVAGILPIVKKNLGMGGANIRWSAAPIRELPSNPVLPWSGRAAARPARRRARRHPLFRVGRAFGRGQHEQVQCLPKTQGFCHSAR